MGKKGGNATELHPQSCPGPEHGDTETHPAVFRQALSSVWGKVPASSLRSQNEPERQIGRFRDVCLATAQINSGEVSCHESLAP